MAGGAPPVDDAPTTQFERRTDLDATQQFGPPPETPAPPPAAPPAEPEPTQAMPRVEDNR
jgi:hypothetical protein